MEKYQLKNREEEWKIQDCKKYLAIPPLFAI